MIMKKMKVEIIMMIVVMVIFAKGVPRMIIGFTLIHEKPKMVTMTLVMVSLAKVKPRLIIAMLTPHFYNNFFMIIMTLSL